MEGSIRDRWKEWIEFDHWSFTPYTRWVKSIDERFWKPNRWDLIVLLWYPGMWKTDFTFFVTEQNAKKWNKCAYLTLELSKKQLLQRKARKSCWVSYVKYQNANYEERQSKIMDENLKKYADMENMNIIWCKEIPSIEELWWMIHECKNKWIDFVVIDNLWKIDNCAIDMEKQAKVTSYLQNLKNELDMSIILVHHLKKPYKWDVYKPWWWSAFSGSQKIKDNCTVMIEIWRDLDPYSSEPSLVKFIQYKQTWDGTVWEWPMKWEKWDYLDGKR